MNFLWHRLLQALVSVVGVVTFVFFVLRLSGDPVLLLVPDGASQEAIDQLRRHLGFDQPIYVQYVDYIRQLLSGDFGQSLVQRRPALELIGDRLPYTLYLAAASLFIALALGLPLGVAAAVYNGRWIGRVVTPLFLVGQSMPPFWSGMLLILALAVYLPIFPSSGADSYLSVVLPAIALGALSMATVARITRSSVLEQYDKPYVRALRAKGIGEARILLHHLLRNASIPVITVAALELGNLLAGAIIVESLFAWPGIGQLAIQSILSRDFIIVQALVLLSAIVYIGLNLIADLLYGIVDPRIRVQG